MRTRRQSAGKREAISQLGGRICLHSLYELDYHDQQRATTPPSPARPRLQLAELLGFAHDGDTVVVHSMDRPARNLDDLRSLVQTLIRQGVHVEFVKEHLLFTGEDSPIAHLMLSVMGASAEFERSLIRERQREGISLAKQRGAYRGRKNTLTPERAARLVQRAANGIPKTVLAADYGISRETVHQYLRQARLSLGFPARSSAALACQMG